MKHSRTHDLQLNKGQMVLSAPQQDLLIEVIDGLLDANCDPHKGSMLIVHARADGTSEEILSGNLMSGKAIGSRSQKIKRYPHSELRLINEAHYNSADYVDLEVRDAVRCSTPGTFYYDKIDPGTGGIYAENGHYVLSLPIDSGRIVASFRASYCQRDGSILPSISEPLQHRLMLMGLAEAFRTVMPLDQRLADSIAEIMSAYERRSLAAQDANDALAEQHTTRDDIDPYSVVDGNSELLSSQKIAHA